VTPREKLIKALKREKITGHVPHFELAFFLTMEALGKIHPQHRNYEQWYQMSKDERRLHTRDMAETYVAIAEKYNHSAIFVQPHAIGNWDHYVTSLDMDPLLEVLEEIRAISNDKYFIMIHGDPTFAIPAGDDMVKFSTDLYENPEKLHETAAKQGDHFMKMCDIMHRHGGLLDGFALCSDYCLNTNPFFPNDLFEELIMPYLSEIIAYYRSHGFYTIKHTDGNINPIVEQLVSCKPDALHSIDPQGHVDLKNIKKRFGDRVCIIGNVNCGLLQTGTIDEMEADVRRSLRDGMESYGYIFSTSNCVFTGLELSRYERMHRIWREEGIYDK